MTTSSTDPHNVLGAEAVALTRKALRSTEQHLRDSDELLDQSKAMRRADESPPDETVQDE